MSAYSLYGILATLYDLEIKQELFCCAFRKGLIIILNFLSGVITKTHFTNMILNNKNVFFTFCLILSSWRVPAPSVGFWQIKKIPSQAPPI